MKKVILLSCLALSSLSYGQNHINFAYADETADSTFLGTGEFCENAHGFLFGFWQKRVDSNKCINGGGTYEMNQLLQRKIVLGSQTDTKNGFLNASMISPSNYEALNRYLYNQPMVDVSQNFHYFTINNANYLGGELVSAFFGPVRFAVGGMFKVTTDTFTTGKNDSVNLRNNLKKVVNNGGTINLNFSMPLIFSKSRYGKAHFGLFAIENIGFNPNVDTAKIVHDGLYSSDNIFYNSQTGLMPYFDLGSADANSYVRMYFEFPFYYSFGNFKGAVDKIGCDFTMLQMRGGIKVGDLFSMNITGSLWSTNKDLQSMPFVVSISGSPSQLMQTLSKGEDVDDAAKKLIEEDAKFKSKKATKSKKTTKSDDENDDN